jgi:antirestriction protein ArdC
MNQENSADLYQRVTHAIVTAIEAGAGDYQMPWNTRLCRSSPLGIPSNPVGGYSYRGINILSLWRNQEEQEFPTPEWATYQQWQSIGAQVKKGEKASISIFYKPLAFKSTTTTEEDASRPDKSRPFIIKAAYVFNAAQVDGYAPTPFPPVPDDAKHEASEYLISASGAKISVGGPKACYIPSRDEIHMPPQAAFINSQAYYGVAFHELSHWTGHKSRCARSLEGRFGSEAYAIEELIAELSAAFLSAELGLAPEPRIDHARYISSWLKVLKNDKRAVFTAAAKANEAANFLKGLASLESGHNEAIMLRY